MFREQFMKANYCNTTDGPLANYNTIDGLGGVATRYAARKNPNSPRYQATSSMLMNSRNVHSLNSRQANG